MGEENELLEEETVQLEQENDQEDDEVSIVWKLI